MRSFIAEARFRWSSGARAQRARPAGRVARERTPLVE
jgi:hypothetical protein